MSTPSDAEHRLRAANTVPPESDKPAAAWSSTVLLERIDERVADVEQRGQGTIELVPRVSRPRLRGPIVAVALAAAVLVPVFVSSWFLRADSEHDVATALTPATTPATTLVEQIQTDASDVPFYARISYEEIFHDEDWAVIVFHRPPNCIPPNANLLDVPNGTAVSDCGPSTVEGVATWLNGPDIDSAPLETEFAGLGDVPVWFVRWPLLERAVDDGVLTRRDLLSMQTRVEGTATTYRERSAPDMLEIAGSGALAGGQPFSFSVSHAGSASDFSLTWPFSVELVTVNDLEGAWENNLLRVEFDSNGTWRVVVTRSEGFGSAQPPPDSEAAASEGTFDLISSVLTFSETAGDYCVFTNRTGTYFAQIGDDGLLVLDYIAGECPSGPEGLGEPFSRAE